VSWTDHPSHSSRTPTPTSRADRRFFVSFDFHTTILLLLFYIIYYNDNIRNAESRNNSCAHERWCRQSIILCLILYYVRRVCLQLVYNNVMLLILQLCRVIYYVRLRFAREPDNRAGKLLLLRRRAEKTVTTRTSHHTTYLTYTANI